MKLLNAITGTVLITLTTAALFSGCAFFGMAKSAKFKPPTLAFSHAKVNEVEPHAAEVDFHLKVNNPNTIGLKGVTVSYELFYEGRRFLAGDDIVIDLAPSAERPLVIPTEIVYTDVFQSATGVTLAVAQGAKTIPVRFDAVMNGSPTLVDSVKTGTLWLPFAIKISRVVDVPIPQDKIDAAKTRAKDSALKKIKKKL